MNGTDKAIGGIPPVFLGIGGRVGRLVLDRWTRINRGNASPPSVGRRPAPGSLAIWDMLAGPPPPLTTRSRVLISLAGVTPRGDTPLSDNTDLALAALAAGRAWGMAHVFVCSSSAVYGDPGPDPVAEIPDPEPLGAYGKAKLAMERALHPGPDDPGLTILRLGNVAGAGEPFDSAGRADTAPVELHRFADGRGPHRSYIGPDSLARVLAHLARLAAAGHPLPRVLNVAAPGAVAMADILDALGQPWRWVPAPLQAIQTVHLDTARLTALCPQPARSGSAAGLVAELDRERTLP